MLVGDVSWTTPHSAKVMDLVHAQAGAQPKWGDVARSVPTHSAKECKELYEFLTSVASLFDGRVKLVPAAAAGSQRGAKRALETSAAVTKEQERVAKQRKVTTATKCYLCNKHSLDSLGDEGEDENASGASETTVSSTEEDDASRLVPYNLTLEDPSRRVADWVHVHEVCAQWLPDVYYDKEGDLLPRKSGRRPVLDAAAARCARCDGQGGGIQCRKCRKVAYHYPCAREAGCQLKVISSSMRPQVEFCLLCPKCS